MQDLKPYALRPYQVEAIRAVFDAYAKGIHRQLIVMATGLGKTVIVAGVAARSGWGSGRRMFGVMHREELISQGIEKLGRQNPGRVIDFEKSSHHASETADIVLASVQTVGRSGGARLARFSPAGFSKVWIDEVHHAPARSYLAVLKHFGLYDNPKPGKLLLGTTATPERLDRLGYDKLFDDVVYKYGLREGIEDRYLAELLCYRVGTGVDLSGVRTRGGDFVESDLARAVDVAGRNELCIDAYRRHSRDRCNLVFCVNKAHAHHVGELFRRAGAATAVIVDDTPHDERRDAYERLKSGSLQVLVNVAVFTEGVDVPGISAIHLLRPTRSSSLLLQMIGRGTRREEGKDDCQVFDYADAFDDKKLASPGKIFGLPGGWNSGGGSILDQVREVEELQETLGTLPIDECWSLDELKAELVRLDPLRLYSAFPPELEDLTTFKWWKRRPECYCLSWRNPTEDEFARAKDKPGRAQSGAELRTKALFGLDESLEVAQNQLGMWEVRRIFGPRNSRHRSERLERFDSLSGALRFADGWVREQRPHIVILVDLDAPWNRGPATSVQIDALRRKGYPPDLLQKRGGASISKGQASMLIVKPMPRILRTLTDRDSRSR